MVRRILSISTATGVVILFTACRPQPQSMAEAESAAPSYYDGMPEEMTLPYRQCTRNEDCVYVTNGCCRCHTRNADLAVYKAKVDSFKKALNCPDLIHCTLIYRNPPCGTGTITCDEGLCVYHMPAPIPQ